MFGIEVNVIDYIRCFVHVCPCPGVFGGVLVKFAAASEPTIASALDDLSFLAAF